MSSKILYLMYFFEINWINFVFVELPLCSWSLGWTQEIIKPRKQISHGYKETIEAELSYLTERHGFVDDEYVQHSGSYVDQRTGKRRYLNPAQKDLDIFVSSYLRGNEAYNTRITKKYFDDPDLRKRLCPTYLKDPIFQYNNIELIRGHSEHPSLYELKFIEFQYFTRKTELVKVIKCPVVVDGYITRLYFLEINYDWNFSHPHRGYFVFFNKVVPNEATYQPLQLLMYVIPALSKFPEMDTEGEEAELHDALQKVSKRAMNIRLHVPRPQEPTNPTAASWTAKLMIEEMNIARRRYLHVFGEEAEILLRAKNYGFFDLPKYRARPWRMKRMILILDHMGRDYVIDRERMNAVRKIDARKSCRRYIFLNDLLSDRKIFPQEHLLEAGYVRKFVDFTQFEYHANFKPQELLKCPVIYGENKEPRNIYLLPIHYENSAKLPQVFTFFEDPRNPKIVNVYTLSPVPSNVDEIDFDLMDQNLIDLTGVPSTSDPYHSRTSTDLEVQRTASSDSDTAILPLGPTDSNTAPLVTDQVSGPVDSDTASLTTGPADSDTAPLIIGQVFSRTDSLPAYPVYGQDAEGR